MGYDYFKCLHDNFAAADVSARTRSCAAIAWDWLCERAFWKRNSSTGAAFQPFSAGEPRQCL